MPYAIVIENDKEKSRQIIGIKDRPLCGFEKRKDKNYYKVINDPRIISIEISEESKKTPTVIEKNKEKIKIEVPTSLPIHRDSKTYECKQPRLEETIRSYLNNPTIAFGIELISVYNCGIREGLGFTELQNIKYCAKILIDKRDKTLKIWTFDSSKPNPDILIRNAIRERSLIGP